MDMNIVRKQIMSLVLLAFVATMTVGGFLSADMMMKDGMMNPCPFMDNTASICNMTPLEHVSQWQQMFTTTLQDSVTTALLLLLSLVAVFTFVSVLPRPKRPPARQSFARYRYRERIFDPLRWAFSRGILNPKLY